MNSNENVSFNRNDDGQNKSQNESGGTFQRQFKRIPKSLIENVKEIPIDEVVEKYCEDIEMKQSGEIRMTALCPFHGETKPSFTLYLDTNTFYCFGCNVGGDVIRFVREFSGLSFRASVMRLAKDFGISPDDLPPDAEEELTRRDERTEFYTDYAGDAQKRLRKEDRQALHDRGLSDPEIDEFGFGYDPGDVFSDREQAEKMGLISSGTYLPKGRIVIPVTEFGKVVYLIFWNPNYERKYLFPVDVDKPLVGASPANIKAVHRLVEGIFDYFSLIQTGLRALCSLGTCLSAHQKKALIRFEDVVIMFDGDQPGIEAARKLAKEMYPKGKVGALPENMDPNELYIKNPVQFVHAIRAITESAQNALDLAVEKCVMLDDVGAAPKLIESEITPLLSRLDGARQDAAIKRVAKAIKRFGIRIDTLRKSVEKNESDTPDDAEQEPQKATQAVLLINLALENIVEFFHNQDNEPLGLMEVHGHREVWELKSKEYRRWLSSLFFNVKRNAISTETINSALNVLEAMACNNGKQHMVFNRVAWKNMDIWYSLADHDWKAIRITASGWSVESHPSVYFRKYRHQKAQVIPVKGGDARRLFDFVRITDEGHKILLLVYVATCFIGQIAHPILIVHGEQGAAKTTFLKLIRELVDPTTMDESSVPTDERQLIQYLDHNYVAPFGNIGFLPIEVSNTFCRAVTGASFLRRKLYTDDDVVISSFRRCIIVNGINMVSYQSDLLDRAIIMSLERVPDDQMIPETVFQRQFQDVVPEILGGIFDALVNAINIYPTVNLERYSRMADFEQWGYAVAEALGFGGDDFIVAYRKNRSERDEEVLRGHVVGEAILAFMANKPSWEGTPTMLYDDLCSVADDLKTRCKGGRDWPKKPNTMMRRLNEVKPNLKAMNIIVEIGKNNGGRYVTITNAAYKEPEPPSRIKKPRL